MISIKGSLKPDRSPRLSLISLFIALPAGLVIFFSWAVYHVMTVGERNSPMLSRVVMPIANFPHLVNLTLTQVESNLLSTPVGLLVRKSEVESPNWNRNFPAPSDPGYLLVSGADPATKQADVRLIRISDGKTLAVWNPDWPKIASMATGNSFEPPRNSALNYAAHPLLLPDGDLIFSEGFLMARIGACDARIKWVLDHVAHHSNEFDNAHAGVWAPSTSDRGFSLVPDLKDDIRDDSIMHVSLDGKILSNVSFSEILRANDLTVFILGLSGLNMPSDPIHINEIREARSDSAYWQKGDLLISSRHTSTIFLYRPSNNKIIWYKTGPWLNQHSVDFIDDHRISVLNNNVRSGRLEEESLWGPAETNEVMVYDFRTGAVSQPYRDVLAKARPRTKTGGRVKFLPDGGLFFEESDNGRQIRIMDGKILWERINDYDSDWISVLSWSRYLKPDKVREPLQNLARLGCAA